MERICGKWQRAPWKGNVREGEGGTRLLGKQIQGDENQVLVSIVTVTYENASSIERVINSVLEQSYSNLEHIIIDCGSHDGTLQIIREYENYVSYYVSEHNLEKSDAMNMGLALSAGKYIAFLDPDGWYTNDAVSLALDYIQMKKADFSFGDAIGVDSEGASIEVYKGGVKNGISIFEMQPIPHSTMFVSCDAYEKVGQYDKNLGDASDYDMELRLMHKHLRGCKITDSIYYYKVSGDCLSKKAYVDSMCQVLMKYHCMVEKEELLEWIKFRKYGEGDKKVLERLLNIIISELGNQPSLKEDFIKWLTWNMGQSSVLLNA